jgi:hypothetical protein
MVPTTRDHRARVVADGEEDKEAADGQEHGRFVTLGSHATIKTQRVDEMVVKAVRKFSFEAPVWLGSSPSPHQLSQPILLAFMFRRA